jgi:hypothetical protein
MNGRKTAWERKSTIWPAELSNGVDKSFVELDSPPEAGLRVGGEDKTRVTLNTHGSVMGIHS